MDEQVETGTNPSLPEPLPDRWIAPWYFAWPLVIGAGWLTGSSLWAARHAKAYHAFTLSNQIESNEFESLPRSTLLYALFFVSLWLGCATLSNTKNKRAWRWPNGADLSALCLCFVPAWINGLALFAYRFTPAPELSRSIHAFSTAWIFALIWRHFDYPMPWRSWRKTLAEEAEQREFEQSKPTVSKSLPLGSQPLWKNPRSWSIPAYMLTGVAVFYFFHITALSWLRYMNFWAALKDLGLYTQQLWGFTQGRFFLTSVYDLPGDIMLGEHVMPIIAILSPLYALWADPRNLLAIQTLAVALAVWPLYAIALRFGLHRLLAAILGISFLLHPQIQTANLYDFHPDALTPFFLLMMFLAMLERRWRLYWPMALLALCCKEDMALPVAMIGFYAMVMRRQWLAGGLTLILAGVWFVVCVDMIIPYFRQQPYRHTERYIYLVESFLEGDARNASLGQTLILMTTHPIATLSNLLSVARIEAVLQMFGPTLFLSMLAPMELLVAAPALGANLLAESERQHGFNLHYSFSVAPFVYVSAAAGWIHFRKLGRKLSRCRSSRPITWRPRAAFVIGAMGVASVLFCYWGGEMFFTKSYPRDKYKRQDRYETGRDIIARIPPNARVSAQSCLGVHLTNRLHIYEFDQIRDAEYIVLDLASINEERRWWPLTGRQVFVDRVKALLNSGQWSTFAFEEDYLVLRRSQTRQLDSRTVLNRLDAIIRKGL